MKNPTSILFVLLLSTLFTLSSRAEELQSTELQKALPNYEETKQHLIAVTQNNTKDDEQHFITQKELQEILRFIHRDKLSFLDIQNIQHEIEDTTNLDIDQKAEATRLLSDIIYVEGRMNDHRWYSKFYCRFSLQDNPFDEVAHDSIFKRPDLYRDQLTDAEFQEIQKSSGKRSVIGLCWDHIPKAN